ncbi:hypothetical protein HZS_7073 [Henneguya salminicola]|nr:hypothetical protein HZS_7073 [Henneguya salminicola]
MVNNGKSYYLQKTRLDQLSSQAHCLRSRHPYERLPHMLRRVSGGFNGKYIDEKSLCLESYPGQIYDKLFCQLRGQFSDIPYQIPSIKLVLAKIRENRGASNFNAIQTIYTPLFSLNRNGQPFFRMY